MGSGVYEIGQIGDIRFQSPEMVKGRHYNQKTDCWSLGVILFFLFTSTLPFDNEEDEEHELDDSASHSISNSNTTKSSTLIIEEKILNHSIDFELLKNKKVSLEGIQLV